MKLTRMFQKVSRWFEKVETLNTAAARRLRAVPRDRYEQPAPAGRADWRIGQRKLEGAPAPRFSAEKADLIVDAVYRGLLGREPNPIGREGFGPLVQAGRLSEFVDAVVQSEEFKGLAGSLTPEDLSRSLYRGILGRDPEPGGDLATRTAIQTKQLAHRVFDMLLSPEQSQRLNAPPAPTPPSPPESSPVAPPPAVGQDGLDPSRINWLHTDVSRWAITSRLTDVKVDVQRGQIELDHTKKGQWPVSLLGSAEVEGNPWIIVEREGRWYAATYDWLRPGQTVKHLTGEELGRDQIRRPPLDESWPGPRPGELVGFMVSARARDGERTTEERSNIVMVRWPG